MKKLFSIFAVSVKRSFLLVDFITTDIKRLPSLSAVAVKQKPAKSVEPVFSPSTPSY